MTASLKAKVARRIKQVKARRAEAKPGKKTDKNHPAYKSFRAFVCHTTPEYEWNWHHEVIVQHLEALERGDIRRLMVFAPPRSGKSLLTSILYPAWVLGRNPDWPVIGGSHTAGLSGEVCQQIQDLMDTPEYAEVFPETRLRQVGVKAGGKGGKARRTQRLFDVAGRKGSYRGVGTRTRVSGLGMELGILDDPVGDADEAYSTAYRNRCGNWYTSSFRTRKSKTGRILLIQTRWHKDDLAGRLMSRMEEDARADQWKILRFPAIAEGPKGGPERSPGDDREEGEAIWPERVGQFDLAGLAGDKASMGTHQFLALMQQRPTAAEGAKFKEEWFRPRFRTEGVGYRLSDGRFLPAAATWRLIVVDPAATDGTGSDWTAIGVFVVCPGGEILVLDMVRERLPLEKIIPRLKSVADTYRPLYIGIEAAGFQEAVAREARQVIRNVDIRGLHPRGKQKLVRAFPAVARAECGKIYLPEGGPSWLRHFIEEMTSFTGVADQHDDQVDCVAYCVLEAGDPSAGLGKPLVTGRARGAE